MDLHAPSQNDKASRPVVCQIHYALNETEKYDRMIKNKKRRLLYEESQVGTLVVSDYIHIDHGESRDCFA